MNGTVSRQLELSTLAHAPPPVTYTIVLSHQVQPSLARAVASQRSCVSWMLSGLNGNWPNACPDLLVADQSPSTPKTHTPHCQSQPTSKPPMKPLRSKSLVMGRPAPLGTALLTTAVRLLVPQVPDRSRRRWWCIWHRPFGSECRRRP